MRDTALGLQPEYAPFGFGRSAGPMCWSVIGASECRRRLPWIDSGGNFNFYAKVPHSAYQLVYPSSNCMPRMFLVRQ